MLLMHLLDFSLVYRLVQILFAPGSVFFLSRKVGRLGPPGARVLDVGCGPSSLLSRIGAAPVGLDLTYSYMRTFSSKGPCVVASADRIPFASGSFDSVWTIGMLHHVPDETASTTVSEMVRVCRPGGLVVVLDSVMPLNALTRPVAWAVRRMDRGRFVRTEEQLKKVIDRGNPLPKSAERFTYTLNGLEALLSVTRLPNSV